MPPTGGHPTCDLDADFVARAGEKLAIDDGALADWASFQTNESLGRYLKAVYAHKSIDGILKLCASVTLGRVMHERDVAALQAQEGSVCDGTY